MNFSKALLAILFSSLVVLQSCGDDDTNGGNACSSDFDQEAMFINLADNLIIPSYESLQEKVNTLSNQTTLFTDDPTIENLESLKSVFVESYLNWQAVAPYNFGPAATVFLRSSVNNFPLNTMAVESNISSGTYDFDMPDNFDKGFPAIDYLLYGLAENDQLTIDFYNSPNSANHKDYLLKVVADIKQRVDQTLDQWNDEYRATFIANTGTAAGTSLSLIINNLNENYELIKREKLGIPSGVLSLGFTNPDKTEAFYSGISIDLAKAALEATEDFYLGADGIGLDDFLMEVNAQKDNIALDDIIQERLNAAISSMDNLQGVLSEIIENDASPVAETYNEVTKLLVNIKTDMPSVLCVSITYIDNPSDSD